jgi:hypothetical protein
MMTVMMSGDNSYNLQTYDSFFTQIGRTQQVRTRYLSTKVNQGRFSNIAL